MPSVEDTPDIVTDAVHGLRLLGVASPEEAARMLGIWSRRDHLTGVQHEQVCDAFAAAQR